MVQALPAHPPTQVRQAVFLGSKSLGLSILRVLLEASPGVQWSVIHPDDTSDARSVLDEFRQLCHARALPFSLSASGAETRTQLARLRPDIGFVCGWYTLIDPQTLSSVAGGLWGIHNALLPRYRGASPLVWSMIRGEPVVGSSVFRLSSGMDDGELLHQVRVENTTDDDIASILAKIEARLIEELPGRWQALLEGRAELLAQSEAGASYCGQRIEADGLIDWQQAARTVHDFIRAQAPPYPGAFSFLGTDQIRFLASRPLDVRYDGTPGQVLRRNPDGSVWIACGDSSAIEIRRVEIGGQSTAPADCLKSVRLRLTRTPAAA
jgi:methionyl-tRNA formyltransferase